MNEQIAEINWNSKKKMDREAKEENSEMRMLTDWLFQGDFLRFPDSYPNLFYVLKQIHTSQSVFLLLSLLCTQNFWLIAFVQPWCWGFQNFVFFQLVETNLDRPSWVALKIKKWIWVLSSKSLNLLFLFECFDLIPYTEFVAPSALSLFRQLLNLEESIHHEIFIRLWWAFCSWSYIIVTVFLVFLELDHFTKHFYLAVVDTKSEMYRVLDWGFFIQRVHFVFICAIWVKIIVDLIKVCWNYFIGMKIKEATSQLVAALKTQTQIGKVIFQQTKSKQHQRRTSAEPKTFDIYQPKQNLSQLLEADCFVSPLSYHFTLNLVQCFLQGPLVLTHEIMRFLFPLGPVLSITEFWTFNPLESWKWQPDVQSYLLVKFDDSDSMQKKHISIVVQTSLAEIPTLFQIFKTKGIFLQKVFNSLFHYPPENVSLLFPQGWCRFDKKRKHKNKKPNITKIKTKKESKNGSNNNTETSSVKPRKKRHPRTSTTEKVISSSGTQKSHFVNRDLLFHGKWRCIPVKSLPVHSF